MSPAEKAEGIDHLLTRLSGDTRQAALSESRCLRPPIGCGKKLNLEAEFRDSISIQEYRQSALCQNCQDAFFTE